jgi:hypothetical protein
MSGHVPTHNTDDKTATGPVIAGCGCPEGPEFNRAAASMTIADNVDRVKIVITREIAAPGRCRVNSALTARHGTIPNTAVNEWSL